ncbi:MAG: hypothetical protein CMJ18_06735 [Phycisphaeraceae bacterium]|nr:hypothetical protein [Phycisphaeraceae bacterium]
MKTNSTVAIICVGALLAAVGEAKAGGTLSAQSGFFDEGTTWVGGSPPVGVQSTVVPGHTVTIRTNSPQSQFYFWDENDGGGTVEIDPGSVSTISARGTNQKFEGNMNIRSGAFVRFGNQTGTNHFSLNGTNTTMLFESTTEWFTDNADSRIFMNGSGNTIDVNGLPTGDVDFGNGGSGSEGFFGIYLFGTNNTLDAEYANFAGKRAIFINDQAVNPTVHIKDSIFNNNTAAGGIIFNENADARALFERSSFTSQPVRSILNKSRVELIDANLDGRTLGDLVIFSGSPSHSSDRWAASYSSSASGAYEILASLTDVPISYQAFEIDPTLASDVSIHPDLSAYSPSDGHESSTSGQMILDADGFANTLTLDAVTLKLNGFTMWVNVIPDSGTLALIDTSMGGSVKLFPEPTSAVLLAFGAVAMIRRRR